MKYCESIFETKRFQTREMRVGKVLVGNNEPIRIQSMTTTPTHEVEATVEQIMRLQDVGCEMARVTVQGKKEAAACEKIKTQLLQKGYDIPLIADIHFYPPAALLVADFVEKIRINPGNFVDKRASFRVIEYDDASYEKELIKIEEIFTPFVEKCKKNHRALRIGTNHGSLSDRIMNRFGDTPKGMVESAFEFARICRKLNFHNFCFSMKASNPLTMIQAYRLLVAEMMQLGWDYPIHLGVTEAGEGEDGRIKSAFGIGSLLLDGIGDTIRVSLTEPPENEIEPCKQLAKLAQKEWKTEPFVETKRKFQNLEKRSVQFPNHLNRQGFVLTRQGDRFFSEGKEVFLDQFICLIPKLSAVHETRKLVEKLKEEKNQLPLVIDLERGGDWMEQVAQIGAILCDGLAEGVIVKEESFGLNLLQAARMRLSKTDFISCPSCGRTLFDLQEVSKRIRDKTGHLAGVKIAIMGCIVNGPGEMADADFGYVGSKPGKVDLYVGKSCVEKDIDFSDADTKLIELIKKEGKWQEV